MKIIQKINSKDLVSFNHYLLDKNISFRISTLILGLLSIIISIASIVYEIIKISKVMPLTIIICVILFILGVFAIFFLKPVLKVFVKKRVIKKNEQIDDICIVLNDAGFLWLYADEEKNKTEATPYTWNSIIKAVEKEEYIYVHVNQYIVLFIKKEACENVEEVTNFLKEKLTIRYKNK